MIKDLLNKLLNFLLDLKRPVASLLQPGLDKQFVESQLANLGLNATKELLSLYEWRNGTRIEKGDTLDDTHLFPGFYFMSLEDAIEQYLLVKDDSRWAPGWFPVFANGGGDFYVVDLSQGNSEAVPVIGFLIDQSNHPVEYESLTAMLETLAECLKDKVFFVTKEGYFEVDDMRHAAIARLRNPTVELWQKPA